MMKTLLLGETGALLTYYVGVVVEKNVLIILIVVANFFERLFYY